MTTAIVRISEQEARALTERIKVAADELWRLLKQAHDGQAWAVLGYESWKSYTHLEFGMGEAHSYRLLEHAEFMEVLDSPVGEPVTERSTRPIRSHPELVAEVKHRIANGATPQAPASLRHDVKPRRSVVRAVVRHLARQEPRLMHVVGRCPPRVAHDVVRYAVGVLRVAVERRGAAGLVNVSRERPGGGTE